MASEKVNALETLTNLALCMRAFHSPQLTNRKEKAVAALIKLEFPLADIKVALRNMGFRSTEIDEVVEKYWF